MGLFAIGKNEGKIGFAPGEMAVSVRSGDRVHWLGRGSPIEVTIATGREYVAAYPNDRSARQLLLNQIIPFNNPDSGGIDGHGVRYFRTLDGRPVRYMGDRPRDAPLGRSQSALNSRQNRQRLGSVQFRTAPRQQSPSAAVNWFAADELNEAARLYEWRNFTATVVADETITTSEVTPVHPNESNNRG